MQAWPPPRREPHALFNAAAQVGLSVAVARGGQPRRWRHARTVRQLPHVFTGSLVNVPAQKDTTRVACGIVVVYVDAREVGSGYVGPPGRVAGSRPANRQDEV